jgi:orotate phosphoribosyltransferase
MPRNNGLEKLFKKSGAMLEGHFKLSSGLHADRYLQCARALQYPEIAGKLCGALAGKFKDDSVSAVVAPALGGVLVSYEVARALGVRSLFTERVDGTMCLRRGFGISAQERVLVVEDVVTTGLSTREVIDAMKRAGALVIGVGCLVDRSQEGIDFGVRFECLMRFKIPAFAPETCPLCKAKIPLTKPGSRV